MRKNYRNILTALVFGTGLLGSVAYAADKTYDINGILYSVVDESKGTAMVYEAKDNETLSGDIVIPEKVTLDGKEYTVTEIDGTAFKDCTKITSMTLPSTLTEIGGQAFNGCRAMKSCNLQDTKITALNTSMFLYCNSLETITIPATVTSYGINPFMETLALKEIKVAEGCPSLTSIDGVLFSVSKKTLVAFPAGKTTDYTVPEGTDTIGNSAFCMARKLRNVKFPESVIYMDNSAFLRADSLQLIEVPKNVKRLGSSTFAECKVAKGDIVIPNTCTYVSTKAFYYTSINSLVIPASIGSVPNYIAQYCVKLRKVELEDGLTMIGSGAFHTCAISEINIPNSVTRIKDTAFEGSTLLKKITIGTGLKTIDIRAFNKLTAITEINIAATTPPSFTGTATYPCFTETVYNNCVLSVPGEALEAYKAAEPWKNFKQILPTVGINEIAVDNISVDKVPGAIIVSGAENMPVSVINLAGTVVYQGNEGRIELPAGAIYIVKIGAKAFKVAM